MKVLIVGASGFIGSRLVRKFAAKGHPVICCGRHVEGLHRQFPQLLSIPVDFGRDGLDDWLSRLGGVDLVINAAGVIGDGSGNPMDAVHTTGPQALFEACMKAGVKQVIQISALGADPAGATRYYRSKGSADAFLAGVDPPRKQLRWTIIRPSVVVGRGGGSHGLFASMAAWPLMPRLGQGRWRVQPIHVLDLVELVYAIALDNGPIPPQIEAAGAEPLTTDGLTAIFRQWLGLKPGRFMTIPTKFLIFAGWVGDRLPLGPLNSDALAMLMGDNVRSTSEPVNPDGCQPRSLELAMLEEPATEADLWQARLFHLRPLLRWVLGLFWIASGLIPILIHSAQSEGYALLERLDLTGGWADATLYGAAALDVLLGGLLLASFKVRLVGGVQIFATLFFSAIIIASMPEFLWHPFGSLTKNIPLIAATAIMMILEE
ncbi:MAG: SDR family oxidoreductase [Magnetococcales bacterium]|nr:SDR family oxidoreductase [Magnetococcales bacterium]